MNKINQLPEDLEEFAEGLLMAYAKDLNNWVEKCILLEYEKQEQEKTTEIK